MAFSIRRVLFPAGAQRTNKQTTTLVESYEDFLSDRGSTPLDSTTFKSLKTAEMRAFQALRFAQVTNKSLTLFSFFLSNALFFNQCPEFLHRMCVSFFQKNVRKFRRLFWHRNDRDNFLPRTGSSLARKALYNNYGEAYALKYQSLAGTPS